MFDKQQQLLQKNRIVPELDKTEGTTRKRN